MKRLRALGQSWLFEFKTSAVCGAVYAPDLMGFGSTAKPADLTYDPHLWYEQIADFAAEVVGEPCVLVGNSIGSQVHPDTTSFTDRLRA